MATIVIERPEDYSHALEELTRAAERDPDNAKTRFERGMALLGLNRKTEAVAEFDYALAIQNDYADAFQWRSCVLESLELDSRLSELRASAAENVDEGVNPLEWADLADALGFDEGRCVLEEYFKEHAQHVSAFAEYETVPMRHLAWLLLQSSPDDQRRGAELAQRAFDSKHRCPDDILVHAVSLQSGADPDEARRVCLENLQIDDQTPYHIRSFYQWLTGCDKSI